MFDREVVDGEEVFHPQPRAASQWAGGSTMRGLASSALMARCAEHAVPANQAMRPVRWTADLSRPVPMRPSRLRFELLREGRRLKLVDVEMIQDGLVVARGRALFLRPADRSSSSSSIWVGDVRSELPPRAMKPTTPERRLYFSEDVGWTSTAAEHQNASRKQIWTFAAALVSGEPPTPFQSAAGVADLASVVTHWGTHGVEYINADITLSLARLPRGPELGITAAKHLADTGIAIGTAFMHDREGVFGTATASALTGRERSVSPGARDRTTSKGQSRFPRKPGATDGVTLS